MIIVHAIVKAAAAAGGGSATATVPVAIFGSGPWLVKTRKIETR
jgi:hypothetical protein